MTLSAKLASGLVLEDDWYAVQKIDERTFAFGEPLYQQQNWSYLFVGETGTLLFDTGSFCRDITGVVERRARGPLTALPSHMHFDHLGNVTKFDSIAVADLPMLRDCVNDGLLTPTEELFLGAFEGNTGPQLSSQPLGRGRRCDQPWRQAVRDPAHAGALCGLRFAFLSRRKPPVRGGLHLSGRPLWAGARCFNARVS